MFKDGNEGEILEDIIQQEREEYLTTLTSEAKMHLIRGMREEIRRLERKVAGKESEIESLKWTIETIIDKWRKHYD